MIKFIAVTPYEHLTDEHITRLLNIEAYINGCVLRTPMLHESFNQWITELIERGYPRSKIIIHSDFDSAEKFNISQIHFGEGDDLAHKIKENDSKMKVSMSVHHPESIWLAKKWKLDYGLYGHLFPSKSKEGILPRTSQEIQEALSIGLPLVAIGGINQDTVQQVSSEFEDIAAIQSLMTGPLSAVQDMYNLWQKRF